MVGKKWKRGELNSFLNEDKKVQIKDKFDLTMEETTEVF